MKNLEQLKIRTLDSHTVLLGILLKKLTEEDLRAFADEIGGFSTH